MLSAGTAVMLQKKSPFQARKGDSV